MKSLAPKLPTFARCVDGVFYQDLVYQDFPARRAWFISFDSEEPAEIVVREDTWKEMPPSTILERRGFKLCLKGIMPGRKDAHQRFFGAQDLTATQGHPAISWFLIFKKGIPLPTPNGLDSYVECYPYFPNKNGVYFGDKR